MYWDARQVRLTRVTYLPLDRAAQTDRYFAGDLAFTDSFFRGADRLAARRLGTRS